MPHISVITPAFNSNRTIHTAIESVLSQTFGDWELIIVDDGSTDDTCQVVQSYQDPRIQYLRQANSGAAIARNTGIAASRGDLLIFLDSDDWWEPYCLEDLSNAFHAQSAQCDAVHCDWAYVDTKGVRGEQQSSRLDADGALATLLLRNPFVIHAVLVRRALVLAVGGFPSETPTLEDWEFWLRLALKGCEFVHMPKLLAYYYWRPGSKSKDADARRADRLATLARVWQRDDLPAHLQTLRAKSYATAYIDFCITDFALGDSGRALDHFLCAVRYFPQIAARVDTYYRILHTERIALELRPVERANGGECELGRQRIDLLLEHLRQEQKASDSSVKMADARFAAYWALGLTCYRLQQQREARSFMNDALKSTPKQAFNPAIVGGWTKAHLPLPLLNWVKRLRHRTKRIN